MLKRFFARFHKGPVAAPAKYEFGAEKLAADLDAAPPVQSAPAVTLAPPKLPPPLIIARPPVQDLECPACSNCFKPAKPHWRISFNGKVTRLCSPCFRLWEHPKGTGESALIGYCQD